MINRRNISDGEDQEEWDAKGSKKMRTLPIGADREDGEEEEEEDGKARPQCSFGGDKAYIFDHGDFRNPFFRDFFPQKMIRFLSRYDDGLGQAWGWKKRIQPFSEE